MAFRYPEHPNSNRIDPFEDERGRNPFADPEAELSPEPKDVFEASVVAQPNAYQPANFVTSERSRGGLLFLMGSAGLLATAFAASAILGAFFAWQTYFGSVLSAVAAPLLLGGAASWSAWLMARYDLSAMRAGAMERGTEGKTRWAHRMGIAGSLLAIAPVIVLIVALIRAIMEEF